MLTPIRTIVWRLSQYRSTRFTAEGLWFLCFTVAVGVAAINTGNNLFYLLLAMMLGIILISGIMAEYCLRQLEFSRHIPGVFFAHEPVTATIVVKNSKSRLPAFSLELFDVSDGRDLDRGLFVSQLLPGASRLLPYPIISAQRGWLKFDGVRVTTSFPFGLFLKKAYYPSEGRGLVCPAIKPISDEFLHDMLVAGQEHAVHQKGFGSDLYNLRLYCPGDDSRTIHWVTTARTSKLIVRETEAEHQRRATICLSLIAPDSHSTIFEEAVTFTASLLYRLASQGYSLKLIAGLDRSSFGQGEAHLLDLLRILALCERYSPASDNEAQAELFAETDGLSGGMFIIVKPWHEATVHDVDDGAIVINAAMLAGASHAH